MGIKTAGLFILVLTLGACVHRPQELTMNEQTPADIGVGLMDRLKQNKDVLEKRQFMLAEDITNMKKEKQHLEREQALVDHQARAFGYPVWVSSLDGFRRAGTSLPATVYHLEKQIQSSELELMNLQNSQAPVIGAN